MTVNPLILDKLIQLVHQGLHLYLKLNKKTRIKLNKNNSNKE